MHVVALDDGEVAKCSARVVVEEAVRRVGVDFGTAEACRCQLLLTVLKIQDTVLAL